MFTHIQYILNIYICSYVLELGVFINIHLYKYFSSNISYTYFPVLWTQTNLDLFAYIFEIALRIDGLNIYRHLTMYIPSFYMHYFIICVLWVLSAKETHGEPIWDMFVFMEIRFMLVLLYVQTRRSEEARLISSFLPLSNEYLHILKIYKIEMYSK